MQAALYEVWWSAGNGTHIGPRFKHLDDAIRYVHDHEGEASHAIRGPSGRWEFVEKRRVSRADG